MSADQSILDLEAAAPEPAIRSRRAILAAAGGAAAAVLATLARPLQVDAGAGDPIRIGRANKGGGTSTTLTTNTDSGAAFKAVQKGHATALVGQGSTGVGVRGSSTIDTGVVGQSQDWVGVGGFSQDGFAIWGESTNNYAGFFVNHVYIGSWVDVAAIPEPDPPGEGQARLFVWDDSGKTTLSVKLPDGTKVDLAAETPG